MRKLTASFFISLDGVVESPDQWHFQYFNEEMGAAIGAAMAKGDAMLLGRVNYQQWADYWPNQPDDEAFASVLNNIPKYVVSNTLETATWKNTTLINGDVAAEIRRLKQQPGKNINMSGSGTLVRWLLANDLVDELHLMIHPVVVGRGKRLFGDEGEQKTFKLASSTTFSTGVVYLVYEREGSA